MQLYHRIKKYLFLLATFFCIAIGTHSVLLYLYHDAEIVPERGGTFHIGFIGTASNLNPTQYGTDNANDLALSLLYRWLLRYNVESRQIEGDLANCDISKSYAEVKCIFKKDSEWSDGTKMTIEDVLSTYSLLAETGVNKRMSGILAKFAITREGEALVFRAAEASSEYLEIFMLPVIKKSVAEKFRNGSIRPEDALFSGRYTLEKQDTTKGISSIFLTQNLKESPSNLYNRIVLRYYPDTVSLESSQDTLNLVIPERTWVNLTSRFTQVPLSSPNFIALFQNSERLSGEFRKTISNTLYRSLETRSLSSNTPMLKSPFFIEGTVFQTTSTGELDSKKLESLGYFTRARLDTLFPITTPLNIIPLPTPERVSGSGSTPSPVPTPVVVSPAPKDPPLVRDLTFFTTPSRLSPTVVGLSDEIVLRGSVPNSVDSVYIGSYRLKTYVKGSGTFTYRARLDIGNLRNGENIYTLSFETAGIRQEKETLRVWMISDPKLRAEKIASLTPVPMTSTGTSGEESGSGTDLLVSTTLSGVITPPAKPTPIPTPEVKPLPIAAPSDPKFLYTRDRKRAQLVVAAIETGPHVIAEKEFITNILSDRGFEVENRVISPDAESIRSLLKGGSKNYDILITGVNLGFMGNYLFPYLHSGQSENGFNFSKIRNPNLDILLEELKNKELSPESLWRNRNNISTILQNEAVFLPLSESPENYYIDSGVRDFWAPSWLPNLQSLSHYIARSYIDTTYIVSFEKKSISGFWDFLQAQFSSSVTPLPWETP